MGQKSSACKTYNAAEQRQQRASAKNTAATATFPAPSAFINPTSRRRSKIAVAIAAETASADANNAASVISSIKPLIAR